MLCLPEELEYSSVALNFAVHRNPSERLVKIVTTFSSITSISDSLSLEQGSGNTHFWSAPQGILTRCFLPTFEYYISKNTHWSLPNPKASCWCEEAHCWGCGEDWLTGLAPGLCDATTKCKLSGRVFQGGVAVQVPSLQSYICLNTFHSGLFFPP